MWLGQVLDELTEVMRIRPDDAWAVEYAKVQNYLQRVSSIIVELEALERRTISRIA